MSILAESVHCIAVCVDMAVSDRGDFCQVLHLVDIATVSTERLCDIIMYKRRQGPPKTFSQIVDVLVREKKEKKKKKKGFTLRSFEQNTFVKVPVPIDPSVAISRQYSVFRSWQA